MVGEVTGGGTWICAEDEDGFLADGGAVMEYGGGPG